jgi:homoserine dehydrogenase
MNEVKTVGITLLGCGTVGTGVVELLADRDRTIRLKTGLKFDLRHVVVRDPSKPGRPAGLPLTTDIRSAVTDPAVDIVIELIGGTTQAGDAIRAALSAGKSVVTANKSLLSVRGPELFSLARARGGCIGFEASCGGGIPIIHALTHGLLANRIDALVGIVNGTCNFILTQMTRNGWSYNQSLAEAQRLGFAESDPALDVSGRDAGQKLAVLAGLAFNARVTETDVSVSGIDTLQPIDLKLAGEIGYVIKLLAIGTRVGDRLALRVHPTLVPKDDVLADVGGSFNAVSVYGSAVGHALFYGRGAGRMPTASAVVADVIDVALGITPLAFKRLNVFPDTVESAAVCPPTELAGRYYLRLTVKDEPGVFAQVTQLLGEQRISLSAVLQHETNDGQSVPVVITTHRAVDGAIRRAIRTIDALAPVAGPTVCIPILDAPPEFSG